MVVLYRLYLLPLAEFMQEDKPGVLQTYYTDDLAILIHNKGSSRLLRDLMVKGLFCGYFTDTEKS